MHNYLREEGADLWNGSLFVFDGRMAVPPPGARDATTRSAQPANSRRIR